MPGAVNATFLRANLLVDPLAVEGAPTLSWIPEASVPERHGSEQALYRIAVASSRDKLEQKQFDLWDSGFVRSSDCYGVAFEGRLPEAGQDAWWMVKLIDPAGGESEWSEPALWSQRIDGWPCKWIGWDAPRNATDPIDLSGCSWIWHPDESAQNAKAGGCSFKIEFETEGGEVEIIASADDHYSLSLDAAEVLKDRGSHLAWSSPGHYKSDLFSGRHIVEVTAVNDADGPAGFIAKILIDGKQICTGTDWMTKREGDADWRAPAVVGAYGDQPWGRIKLDGKIPQPKILRKEAGLKGRVVRARLHASAFGIYTVAVNGEEVSDEFFAPGWTDYEKRLHFRTYDVTSMIEGEAVCLSAVLGDGWYSGFVGYGAHRDHYGSKTRFGCLLDLVYEDGSTDRISTDESWRVSTGGLEFGDFLRGEYLDVEQEPDGWRTPGFDDSSWSAPDLGAELDPSLEPYPMTPCVTAMPVLKPQAFENGVFDFGQNTAGVTRIKARGPKGSKVHLSHGEVVNDDGSLYIDNLRGAQALDTLILDGETTEFTPKFTFHGFRYVEMTSNADHVELEVLPLSNLTRLTGDFSCSDPRLNQLWSNIVWTQLMNFIEVPTDCPQRDERLGWTGDAQVFAGTACYAADVQTFFRKWLIDLSDSQREDGQYPMVAPLKVAGGDGGPGWADAGVVVPWALYEAYGDRAVLETQYPSMQKFVEFLLSRSDEPGVPPKEFHCFGDWVSVEGDIPKEVTYTAFFGQTVDLMSKIAGVLDRPQDAAEYRRLFEQVKSVFNRDYVSADGTVRGDRQCSYVLALSFGLLEGESKRLAEKKLADEVEEKGHLTTGFLGTRDLPRVLRDMGRTDLAYRLLMRDEYPGWLFPIKHGATSIWERWNGWTPENGFADPGMNSFAHYAFGAVGQFMWETVVGLRPLEPGYRRFLVAPEPGPLEHAQGVFDSISGKIDVAWKNYGTHVGLDLVVPPGTTALVRLPGMPEFEVGPGQHVFDSKMV